METADIKTSLKGFFSSYLVEQRQASPHTLKSYRDTFKLLLEFARKKKSTSQIRLTDLDVPLILDFLKNLEDSSQGRGNSISTRNYRLAAIRSFFKYVAWQWPSLERQAMKIRAIPIKKSPTGTLDYLTHQELQALFSCVDARAADGYRDLTLLTYLYNTGARSQEAADTRIGWFDFAQQLVTIRGKGNKERTLPLWPATIEAVQTYLKLYRRQPKLPGQDFLFIGQRGKGFTRFGVRCIVKKYLGPAAKRCASLGTKRLSTHSLRHTCAMHLLEDGVEVNVIKAWLGHEDLSSTGLYLHESLIHKKAALAKFGPPIYVKSSFDKENSGSVDQALGWLDDL